MILWIYLKQYKLQKKHDLMLVQVNIMLELVLLLNHGKYYSGCNIENDGIQSICAERTAFVKALSEGEREFSYIVVVGGLKSSTVLDNCLPCGYCRQFMNQYVDNDFKIYACFGENDEIEEYSINDLLPHGFKLQI